MGLLVYSDYIQRANDQSIQQWIANNATILATAEANAEEEIKSYITQRYDATMAFNPTLALSESAIYQANQLVQLNFPAWSSQGVYAAGAYQSYTDGNVYRCILATDALWISQNYLAGAKVLYTDNNYYVCILNTVSSEVPTNATYWTKIASEGPGNATYWTLIGTQLAFFYISFPYPLFAVTGTYKVGDRVFWKGKIYQALIGTVPDTHYDDLQAHVYANIPNSNQFPDDPQYGLQYWGTGISYSVTGNVPTYTNPAAYSSSTPYTAGNRVLYNGLIWKALLNNNTGGSTPILPGADIITWQSENWTAGDNRSSLLVQYCADIAIYKIMPRVAPKAIPQIRVDNYENALMWLQRVADGRVNANIPKLQPAQGRRTRFGGNVKNINGY